MRKRGILISGIVILVLLVLWMKFQTTDTFKLLFYPQDYFAVENTEADTNPKNILGSDTEVTNELNFKVEANEIQLSEDPKDLETDQKISDENSNDLLELNAAIDHSAYYAYSHMNENMKPLYEKIYDILMARATDVAIPTKIEEEINVAFMCVIQDHPELFFVDGYNYSVYRYGEIIDSILFGGKYSMNEASIKATQTSIDSYVEIFLQGITEEMDTYERVKSAYEFIILNTTYDINSIYNQNANSVFIYQKSVCQGYAEAFQYLLHIMDIPCMVVTGTADGDLHAFNLVNIDGEYYYVDTTWGEGQEVSNADGMLVQEINYNYLNITTEEISKTHTFDSPVALPMCTATSANYYVREGTYFESLDSTKINNAFNVAYGAGKSEITLKCANVYVYEDILTHMFSNEHIFDYVRKSTSRVNYISNDALYTITVYL